MMNHVSIQGRLVQDPEVKTTQSGIKFCNFKVAWSEKYKEVESKCFLPCKAWRNTAELLGKYWQKGKEILLEGRLLTEEWEKDGQKQSRTVLEVQNIHFTAKGESKGNNQAAPAQQSGGFVQVDDSEEPLPF